MSSIDKFMPLIYQIEEEELAPSPIISSEDGIHFLYIKHNNLYRKSYTHKVVAMTKKNSNATVILLFLHKLCYVSYTNPGISKLL